MPALIALSVLFALAKDVVYFGALSDFLRIGSLGLAGAAGALLALGALGRGGSRYAPILLYCVWCLIPIAYASDVSYLIYQVVSQLCIVAAGIGAFGNSTAVHERTFRAMTLTLILSLAFSMALSLAGLWVWPDRVWEYPIGDVRRFRGLMSEPATLGVAAGLLVGFAWAGLRSAWLRYPVVLAGVISLVLTGSRTPFIAMVFAGLCVVLVHKSVKLVLATGLGVSLVIGVVAVAGIHLTHDEVDKAVRSNSLSTMSGRLELWQYGWEAARKQPIFGSGLTLGSEALASDGSIIPAGTTSLGATQRDGREVARATFHNGYLQAYMDSGLVGALLYLLVIGVATWQAYKAEKSIESGTILYVIVFLAVTNIGQNAIQGPSTICGVVFWLAAAAAASLPRRQT